VRRSLLGLGLGLAFGLCAFNTNVFAADSSGTYSGFIKCTIYADDGTKSKTGRQDLIVLVNQEQTVEPVSNLNINFNFQTWGTANGTQFDDANNPSAKASVGAVSCHNNGDSSTLNFVANATLKGADKSNGKAKLKGTASYTDVGENGTCKWKVTRTSVQPPDVPPCGMD
jgi:hypothetical protein